MAGKFDYRFKAPLSPVTTGLMSTVVYIPNTVMKNLPQSRVRVKGRMNGAAFALAVQYRKQGKSFFVVSGPLRKAAKIQVGGVVDVEFNIASDQVDLPEELEAVLAQDDEGMKAWNQLTPGLQRSVCHYITGAKNIDVRIKRSLFLVNKVKQGAYAKPAGKERISTLNHKK